MKINTKQLLQKMATVLKTIAKISYIAVAFFLLLIAIVTVMYFFIFDDASEYHEYIKQFVCACWAAFLSLSKIVLVSGVIVAFTYFLLSLYDRIFK